MILFHVWPIYRYRRNEIYNLQIKKVCSNDGDYRPSDGWDWLIARVPFQSSPLGELDLGNKAGEHKDGNGGDD